MKRKRGRKKRRKSDFKDTHWIIDIDSGAVLKQIKLPRYKEIKEAGLSITMYNDVKGRREDNLIIDI